MFTLNFLYTEVFVNKAQEGGNQNCMCFIYRSRGYGCGFELMDLVGGEILFLVDKSKAENGDVYCVSGER